MLFSVLRMPDANGSTLSKIAAQAFATGPAVPGADYNPYSRM
jgi:hypothetical protein